MKKIKVTFKKSLNKIVTFTINGTTLHLHEKEFNNLMIELKEKIELVEI